jgi:hypothetical protein
MQPTAVQSIVAGSATTLWVSRVVLLVLGGAVLLGFVVWLLTAGVLVASSPSDPLSYLLSLAYLVPLAIFTLVYAWSLYRFGFRIASRLTLDPAGTLRWESGIRTGSIPVVTITRVLAHGRMRSMIGIEHHAGRVDLTAMLPGLPPLLATLRMHNPSIELRIDGAAAVQLQLAEQMRAWGFGP